MCILLEIHVHVFILPSILKTSITLVSQLSCRKEQLYTIDAVYSCTCTGQNIITDVLGT